MPDGGGGGELYPGTTGLHPFRLAAARRSTFPIKGKDRALSRKQVLETMALRIGDGQAVRRQPVGNLVRGFAGMRRVQFRPLEFRRIVRIGEGLDDNVDAQIIRGMEGMVTPRRGRCGSMRACACTRR